MCSVEKIIRESNLIDKQYGLDGALIHGDRPGTPMYDNQLRAIELFPTLIEMHPTPRNLVLMLHRELTRGIDIFEQNGDSGNYRRCNVYIGGEKAPIPPIAISLIEELLIPTIEKERHTTKNEEEALTFAWWCHDLFECAHPFVDGNGRCGRLLFNLILEMFGYPKRVIYYNDRWGYYSNIQRFRSEEFPKLLHMER